ncbi:MAG: DUF131 domain-containing protein [Nanoarchaeota archaeon]
MSNHLLQIGIILVFIGILLIFFSSFTTLAQQKNTTSKSAGGIFIGPFPLFGFASDKNMFYLLLAVTVFLTILSLIFMRLK